MIVGLLRESLFDGGQLLTLCLGGLGLALLAIVIDRFNFPQRRFRPKRMPMNAHGSQRDRTGAHVVDESHRGAETARRRTPTAAEEATTATGPAAPLAEPTPPIPTDDPEPS